MEQRNFLNFLWALFLVTSIFLFLVSSLPAASAPAVTGPTSRLPTPEEIAKIPLIKASDLQKGNTRDITTPNMEDYVLGPGDVLEIRIWGQPELTLSRYRIQTLPDFMVAPDGKVFVPVIGDIQVAGKTLSEVRSEITRRELANIIGMSTLPWF